MGITLSSPRVREPQTDFRGPQKGGVTVAGERRTYREGKQGTETLTDSEGVSLTSGGWRQRESEPAKGPDG